jgi:hypothetical protein
MEIGCIQSVIRTSLNSFNQGRDIIRIYPSYSELPIVVKVQNEIGRSNPCPFDAQLARLVQSIDELSNLFRNWIFLAPGWSCRKGD